MTAFDDALAAVETLVSMHIESGGAFVQPDAEVVEQARAALPVLRAEHDDTRRYLRGCEQWFYPNDTPNKDMAKAVASNYLKLRAEHERVAAERDEFRTALEMEASECDGCRDQISVSPTSPGSHVYGKWDWRTCKRPFARAALEAAE